MPNPSLQTNLDLRARRWFVVGLFLVFVAVGISYSHKVLNNRSAVMRWLPQIRELDNGVDISSQYHFGNPPIMALLLYPILQLPPLAAALLWFALKVGFTMVSFWWVFRLIAPEDRPFPLWAQGLVVLLTLRPIFGDLQHGNVNLLILVLIVASLTAYRHGRDLLAGLVLALAIACKITPALFLPYFLWKRSWRVLAGATIGLVLFFWPGIVPAVFLGMEENQQQLVSWYGKMIAPVAHGQVWSEHNNQSLPGLAIRMFTHSPSYSHYEAGWYTPDRYCNIADLDPQLVLWLVKGCAAVFALAFVCWCRTPTQPRIGWRLSAEFSLILLGMLLFSERTWKHYCAVLMLPFGVICYYLATGAPSVRLRNYLIGTLVGATLLIEATSTTLFAKDFAEMAQTYGAYVWAYLLLIAALWVLLRQKTADRAAPSEVPATAGIAR